MKLKHEALLEDIAAVRELFAKPDFKGKFDMHTFGSHTDWGDSHKPEEQNYCGTAACLAGWLSMVSKNGFSGYWSSGSRYAEGGSFDIMAYKVYGLDPFEVDRLFYKNPGFTVSEKLDEAERYAYDVAARTQPIVDGNGGVIL